MVIIPKQTKIKKGELVLVTDDKELITKYIMEDKNGRKGKD